MYNVAPQKKVRKDYPWNYSEFNFLVFDEVVLLAWFFFFLHSGLHKATSRVSASLAYKMGGSWGA